MTGRSTPGPEEHGDPPPPQAQAGPASETELWSVLLRNLTHVFATLIAAMVAIAAALVGWRAADVHGHGSDPIVGVLAICAALCAVGPLVMTLRYSSGRVRLRTSVLVCSVAVMVSVLLAVLAASRG